MAKTPSFIEVNGEFISKPFDIANYLDNYFLSKVNTLRNQMLRGSGRLFKDITEQHIMRGKDCVFEFKPISVDFVVKQLNSIKCDKPCGFDNIDGRLLKLSAKSIAKPIGHIFNLCFKECAYPDLQILQKKNCKKLLLC